MSDVENDILRRHWASQPVETLPIIEHEPEREPAHALRLQRETPMERYLRQQWEVATASTRVALDALRRMWPLEAAHLHEIDAAYEIDAALVHATKLAEHLALAAKEIVGELMYAAEMGRLTAAQLEDAEGGTDGADET